MKHSRFYQTVVAIAMMLMGWLPSLAQDFEVDGICYNILSDNSVEVTVNFTYNGSYYINDYEDVIIIPETVTHDGCIYSVTSIGEGAFNDSKLTSIKIPNSVTSIGIGAFSGCASLTSIEIPNSVTSIGRGAFSGCASLTSIEIPNSVTRIDDYAFSGCKGLISIEIPNSVTRIGEEAFRDCSTLISVTIPNSVTRIDSYAFYGCI